MFKVGLRIFTCFLCSCYDLFFPRDPSKRTHETVTKKAHIFYRERLRSNISLSHTPKLGARDVSEPKNKGFLKKNAPARDVSDQKQRFSKKAHQPKV